jgi:hypothetical protein
MTLIDLRSALDIAVLLVGGTVAIRIGTMKGLRDTISDLEKSDGIKARMIKDLESTIQHRDMTIARIAEENEVFRRKELEREIRRFRESNEDSRG